MTVYCLKFARCALNVKKNSHNNGVPAIFFVKKLLFELCLRANDNKRRRISVSYWCTDSVAVSMKSHGGFSPDNQLPTVQR